MNLLLRQLVKHGMLLFCKSLPMQLSDPGKDPLEDVAAVASQDPKPLPPEIYTEPPQLDKSQQPMVILVLIFKCIFSDGNKRAVTIPSSATH